MVGLGGWVTGGEDDVAPLATVVLRHMAAGELGPPDGHRPRRRGGQRRELEALVCGEGPEGGGDESDDDGGEEVLVDELEELD